MTQLATTSPVIALVQPADQPPARMLGAATAAEEAGIEEVWLWEDCFAGSGLAPAAAILGHTSILRVGIGLMPAPLRRPTLTAMEIASVAAMFPGRFLPGLGHGVQDWMRQIGAEVASPVTLLREQVHAIRALLHGAEVSVEGRYVSLDRVRLQFPPQTPPPVLIGGRGPRTVALAGAVADGVILDDAAPDGVPDPERVAVVRQTIEQARDDAGRDDRYEMVVFLGTRPGVGAEHIADQITTLSGAGVDRIAVFAGGVDAPPSAGEAIEEFIGTLAAAAALVG